MTAGKGKLVPQIPPNDPEALRRAVNRLAGAALGPGASPTFEGLTLNGLTASTILGVDASKAFESVTIGTGLDYTRPTLSLSHLGIEALTDPGADRIFFWDNSESASKWLAAGNSIAITTTTIDTIQDIRTTASPTWVGLTLSGLTQGSVVFTGASGVISQDNSNLFWDVTNSRLGIGINSGFFPAAGMTVSGEMDLIHTSSESDDHAFELDVNAAGYGDVKAIDIDYITGDITVGEDEAVILINIDEIGATGAADVFGLEVLATEGDAKIYGMKVGVVIGPIHQDSGTFENPTIATNDTPSTNVPYMKDGLIANTTAIFSSVPNDDDYILIGDIAVFEEIEFIITTGSSGAGIKPKFEYSRAGSHLFTEFFPVDGTNGFRNTGVVAWDTSALVNHGLNTDTTPDTYCIKITRQRVNLTTTPILGFAKVAATTEYIWDKDANVNIKTLTISTIAAEGSDVDKFLVDSSGVIKYRTGTQVLSDIGASASGHNHSGVYEPADAGLTSLAGLTYAAAAFVKMTGANTFALRTLQQTSDDLEATIDHDNLLNFAANEHYLQSAITEVGTVATGTWEGTDVGIAHGGSGQSTAQAAIDALTAVGGATNEHVLTKDTASGNAIWKAAGGGAHTHDGDTLQLDGINSDGGAFAFTTSGAITFNQNLIIPNNGTIGQAAGPLLTFDDTNNFLEISGAKVGIGTTTPEYWLTVVDNVSYQGLLVESDYQGNMEIRSHNNADHFAVLSYARSRGTAASPTANVAGDTIAVFNAIGHTNARQTAARIRFECDTGWGATGGDSPGTILLQTTPDGSNNPATRLHIYSDGRVYMDAVYEDIVGGTNRDLFIDNIGKLGYVSSSREHKTNIRDLINTERIFGLRPVCFDRIDKTSKNEMGLIAEEVVNIMPEIVSYQRKEIPHHLHTGDRLRNTTVFTYEETDIPETVNYSRLITPILKELQKLKQRVDALGDKNAKDI